MNTWRFKVGRYIRIQKDHQLSRSQCRRRVALGTGVRQVNHSEVLGGQQDLTRLLESG